MSLSASPAGGLSAKRTMGITHVSPTISPGFIPCCLAGPEAWMLGAARQGSKGSRLGSRRTRPLLRLCRLGPATWP